MTQPAQQTSGVNQQTAPLSTKETRDIVTPYAFHVAPALFGTPLARPLKRIMAFSVDATIVAILSQASSLFLAGVAAITFFRAGSRLKQKKRFNAARIGLRLLGALLLFVLAAGTLDVIEELIDSADETDQLRTALVDRGPGGAVEVDVDNLNSVESLALIGLTAKYLLKTSKIDDRIASGSCPQAWPCWRELGEALAVDLASLGLSQQDAEAIFEQLLEETNDTLTPIERAKLETVILQTFERNKTAVNQRLTENLAEQGIKFSDPTEQQTPRVDEINPASSRSGELLDKLARTEPTQKHQAADKPSLIDWVQGLAADLGLGFGWAAVYFSVFTARWRGQTPGKRLLGIRVIKLDGGHLNLWESFGRYGGYGAGFATGLLGFIQIYWDRNRQAIQDKISETLVIDLRREKIPFTPSEPLGS